MLRQLDPSSPPISTEGNLRGERNRSQKETTQKAEKG
jgi:hypothetical protein